MKNKIIVLILYFILIGQAFCQDRDTLTGKIVQVPNPCLTDPCLPGTIYAIETDTSVFILSIDKAWQSTESPLIRNRDTLEIDDSIKVIGTIYVKYAINDEKYYEIEVDSAYFLATSIVQLKKNRISIYPNPSIGAFFIKSEDLLIRKVDIMNIDGTLLYSSSANT